ncbi:MAG: Cna B-type domain-containing protein [Lachnospiraceae bacterium]|nr:Cna B-type domain-containing protein [Lachnospiraceae bacterium]
MQGRKKGVSPLKRSLANLLAAIMIFSTIGNAYFQSRASEEVFDFEGSGEQVPAQDAGVPSMEETAPADTTVEEVPAQTQTDGLGVQQDAEVTEPVTIDPAVPEEILPPAEELQDPIQNSTDPVNIRGPTLTIYYDASVGGTVSLSVEVLDLNIDEAGNLLYTAAGSAQGSTATPEEGYTFNQWMADDGEVVSTVLSYQADGTPEHDPVFIPDADEIAYVLAHTAPDANGDYAVTYTAQFTEGAPAEEVTLETYVGQTLITATFMSDAFDGPVTLYAEEIVEGDALYAQVEDAVDEATGAEITPDDVEFAAFDICFFDEAGAEVEPKEGSSVIVTISTTGEETPDEVEEVLHIDSNNNVETVAADMTGDDVTFEAGDFSVYIVLGTLKTTTLIPRIFEEGSKYDSTYTDYYYTGYSDPSKNGFFQVKINDKIYSDYEDNGEWQVVLDTSAGKLRLENTVSGEVVENPEVYISEKTTAGYNYTYHKAKTYTNDKGALRITSFEDGYGPFTVTESNVYRLIVLKPTQLKTTVHFIYPDGVEFRDREYIIWEEGASENFDEWGERFNPGGNMSYRGAIFSYRPQIMPDEDNPEYIYTKVLNEPSDVERYWNRPVSYANWENGKVEFYFNEPLMPVKHISTLEEDPSNAGYVKISYYSRRYTQNNGAAGQERSNQAEVGSHVYLVYMDNIPGGMIHNFGSVVGDGLGTPGHQKTLTWTGDYEYDLDLTISGAENVTEGKTKIDVLFIIDSSNSMNYRMSSNTSAPTEEEKRWNATKDAVNTLVSELDAMSGTLDTRYASVFFAVHSDQGTSYHEGYGTTAAANISSMNHGWRAEGPTLANVPNNVTLDGRIGLLSGGTNYQDAFRTAKGYLRTARADAKTIVIFVTDGFPTMSNSPLNLGSRHGFTTSMRVLQDAQMELSTLSCDEFHTIGIAMSSTSPICIIDGPRNYTGGEWNLVDSITGKEMLDTYIIPYVNATTAPAAIVVTERDALIDTFRKIGMTITGRAYKDFTVYDTLSEYTDPILTANGNANRFGITVTRIADGQEIARQFVTDRNDVQLTFTDPKSNEQITVTATFDVTTGQLRMDFPDDYVLNPALSFKMTLQVEPSEEAFNRYAAHDYTTPYEVAGTTAPRGEANTGTHANQPGLWSNLEEGGNTSAYATYREIGYTGNQNQSVESDLLTLYYPRPVLTVEKTEVSVTKIWNDNNNAAGLRPESITVYLYADGDTENPVDSLVLTGTGNTWTGKFTNLPARKDDGTIQHNKVVIDYTVGEEPIGLGYTTTISKLRAGDFVFNIENSLTTSGLTVKKVWNDANDQDGIRPDDVTIELKAYIGGTPYTITQAGIETSVTLNEANDWKYTWEKLQSKDNLGNPITYKVEEAGVGGVPAGYTVSVTGSQTAGYTVTNTHIPATTQFSVVKDWHDDYNGGDGNVALSRPDEIWVQLYQGNGAKVGNPVRLTEKDGWKYTWTDLPARANGTPVTYYVRELTGENGNAVNEGDRIKGKDVDGKAAEYTAAYGQVTGNVEAGYRQEIDNTYEPPVIRIPVKKNWVDQNNVAGKRPATLQVTLYADNVPQKVATLNAQNNWTDTTTFVGLPVYKAGQKGVKIVYRVDEQTVPEYTEERNDAWVYEGATGTLFTNTYTPGTTSVSVKKVWQDGDNRDRIRPSQITVILYQKDESGNVYKTQTATLQVTENEATSWYYKWDNLPLYVEGMEGVEAVYEVKEDPAGIPSGYRSTVSGNATQGFTITNTYQPGEVEVRVVKKWEDADNRDNRRPESVVIRLYKTVTINNVTTTSVVDEVTFSETLGWEKTWYKLPEKEEGQKITYTVKELAHGTENALENGGQFNEFYVVSYSGATTDASNGTVTVTNTHEKEVVRLVVTKNWYDDNNRDGVRPEAISVELYKDGVATGDIRELTAAGNWSVTWTGLDRFAEDHHQIVYTARETGTREENGRILVTFTVDGRTGDYEVVHTDGAAPDIHTISPATNPLTWNTEIADTHTPERISIPYQKVWDDDSNREHTRDEISRIDIQLLQDGTVIDTHPITDPAEIKKEWSGEFTDLYKYRYGSGGTPHNYTINEIVTMKDGSKTVYQITVEPRIVNHTDGYEITNSHTPGRVNVSVVKEWNDDNDRDKLRTEIEVGLFMSTDGRDRDDAAKEWTEVDGVDNIVLNEENKWTGGWTDLYEKEDGVTIMYTVREITDLTPDYEAPVVTVTDGKGYAFHILNVHTIERTNVSVRKYWDDMNNIDGRRPASVDVQLYADDTPVAGERVTLDESNNWSHTWTNLNRNSGASDNEGNAVAIRYTVKELVAGGNAALSPGESLNSYYVFTGYGDDAFKAEHALTEDHVLINTHAPEKASLEVTKNWNDDQDRDGVRPSSITVQMYANGVAVDGEVKTLNEANGWKASWTDLDRFDANGQIVYTARELDKDGNAVESGAIVFAAELTAAKRDGNYTAETTDGAAPLADAPEAQWTTSIVNTHTPEPTQITVHKKWNDNDNQDGLRDNVTSIQLTLYADGVKTQITETVTTDVRGDWTHTFNNLTKYRDGGIPIVYSVEETTVPTGYTVTYTEGERAEDEGTITNTHIPDKTSLTVIKQWDDDDDRDGNRPEIHMQLVKTVDGESDNVGDAVQLTSEKNWRHTWNDLPVREDGKVITYSVKEVGEDNNRLPGKYTDRAPYEVQYGTLQGNTRDGFTISVKNSYTPETVSLIVLKEWKDENNQDGKRPDSIKIHLLADGTQYGTVNLGGTGNTWRDDTTFVGLPKYKAGQDTPISYTILEEVPEDYSETYHGITRNGNVYTLKVDNEYDPEKTNITVVKNWQDDGNRDGIRKDVQVQLYMTTQENPSFNANDIDGSVWKPVQAAKTLGVTDDERTQWTGLPVFENGKKITYAVAEVNVPAGYIATYQGQMTASVTVTNTHAPERMSVRVIKDWQDENNRDGKRPTAIRVQLFADGQPEGEAVTITDATPGYMHTWNSLYVYSHDGVKIDYVVKELDEKGDVIEWTGNNGYNRIYTEVTYEDLGTQRENLVAGDPATARDVHSFKVTNAMEPEKTSLEVQKNWEDAGNQDGVRPAALTVELFAAGAPTGRTVTLNEANGWHGSFTELDRFRAGEEGVQIVYSVKEYTKGGNAIENGGSYGVEHGDPYAVSYTVTAPGAEEEGPVVWEAQIENARTPETTNVPFEKQWDDDSNRERTRDKIREINVYLVADGTRTGDVYTITGDDILSNWSGEFKDVDKYTNPTQGIGTAHEIVYTLNEEIVWKDNNDRIDYTTSYGKQGVTHIIRNAYTPGATQHTVTKTWVDERGQVVIPDNVRVRLTASVPSGADVDLSYLSDVEVTLQASTDATKHWTYTWTGLHKMENGETITYRAVELNAAGEVVSEGVIFSDDFDTTTYDYSAEQVSRITNIHTPEITRVVVEKTWDDDENRDHVRPEAIVVALYEEVGGQIREVERVRLQGDAYSDTGWTYTFDNNGKGLDVTRNGQPVRYFVAERDKGDKFDLNETNGYAWGDGYTATYRDGDPQMTEIGGIETWQFAVENSYTPKTIDLEVTKKWDDAADVDSVRPLSVTFVLEQKIGDGEWTQVMREGTPYTVPVTGTERAESWTATFTGLDEKAIVRDENGAIKETGVVIEYRVREQGEEGGKITFAGSDAEYTVRYPDNRTTNNAYTPRNTRVPVTKIWQDENNRDHKRETVKEITLVLSADDALIADRRVTIKADGTFEGAAGELTGSLHDDTWTFTFTDLPENHIVEGVSKAVVYTVKEEQGNSDVEGSLKQVGYTQLGEVSGNQTAGYEIVNRYIPGVTSVTVTKEWDDDNNRDGMRPDNVRVVLLAEGRIVTDADFATENQQGVAITPVAAVQTLDDGNNWTFTWTGLIEKKDGTPIVYTVRELTADAPDEITAANVMEYVTDAAGNQTAEGDFQGEGLDIYNKDEAGNTVYTAEVTGDMDKGFKVVNRHIPLETEVVVTKIWDDNDDQNGRRPAEITVQLYADGEKLGTPVTFGSEDKGTDAEGRETWSYKWTGLDMYKDGNAIVYTVREAGEEDGKIVFAVRKGNAVIDSAYDVTYDDTAVTITNSTTPDPTEIRVRKVWEDNDNQAGERPATVTVRLLADGVTYTGENAEVTLSEENGWEYTWADLEKYKAGENGVAVKYDVVELTEDLQKEVNENNQYQFNDNYIASYEKEKDAEGNIRFVTVTNARTYIVKSVEGESTPADETFTFMGTDLGEHVTLSTRDEAVTYTIRTQIPAIAREQALDSFVITDELEEVLEFVPEDEGNVKVTIGGTPVMADVTVTGQTLRVAIPEIYLNSMRGEAVVITFDARIREDADFSGKTKYIGAGRTEIPNTAKYQINNNPEVESNPVTITPPPPEIEKEVAVEAAGDGATDGTAPGTISEEIDVHATLVERFGTVTYTIRTEIPEEPGLTGFEITDELENVLEFVGEATVTVGGEAAEGVTVQMDGQELKVTFAEGNAHLKDDLGKVVEVTFRARIRKVMPDGSRVDLSRYITTEGSFGGRVNIPNDSYYTINPGEMDINGNPREKWSNEVNITPPPPTIEKEVENLDRDNTNKEDLELQTFDEEFYYNIKTRITELADGTQFEVHDTLEPVLKFASADAELVVYEMNEEGERGAQLTYNVDYTAKISEPSDEKDAVQKIEVKFTRSYIESHRGQPVWISFRAEQKVGADLTPYINGVERTDGKVPNTAILRYKLAIDDKWTEKESNEVLVKPEPELIDIDVTKEWDDADDQDGIRPEEITVNLYRITMENNVEVEAKIDTKVIKPDAEGKWVARFTGLPKYDNWEPVIYRVREEVPGRYEASYTDTFVKDERGRDTKTLAQTDIMNRHVPGKVVVNVEKVWDDNNNAYSVRPRDITVRLLADGTATGEELTLNARNEWKGAFTDLDEYKPGAQGQLIDYDIEEVLDDETKANYETTIRNVNGDRYTFVINNRLTMGQLTVVKSVGGTLPAGTTVTYTFDITGPDGFSETITITGTGSQTIDVPAGTYTVTERDANRSTVANYTMTTTGSGQSVTVPAGRSATATIVNTYTPPREDPPPQTPPPTPPTPPTAPPPGGQVLGATRNTDAEAVLGARRGKTGEKSQENRLMSMLAGGAMAMLLAVAGRRKRKVDGD